MGRTLHFQISKTNGKPLSAYEHRILYDLSLRYNSGPMEKVWTCENFFPSPYGTYYPNWKHPKLVGKSDDAYAIIDKELAANFGDELDQIRSLVKQKLIRLTSDISGDTIRGFVKTQGNELNSLLTVMGLVEVTEKLPVRVHLEDEGRLLYCPIIIQGGRAIPDLEKAKKDFQRLAARLVLASGYEGNVLGKLKYDHISDHMGSNILNLGNPYGDCTIEYLQEIIDDMANVETVLASQGITGYEMNNLEDRPVSKWLSVKLFHRPVNAKNYLDYKMSPATLMDGFRGEGFGLTSDTAEAGSYRAIAMIQELFGTSDNKDLKLQVLGEEKPAKKPSPRKPKA